MSVALSVLLALAAHSPCASVVVELRNGVCLPVSAVDDRGEITVMTTLDGSLQSLRTSLIRSIRPAAVARSEIPPRASDQSIEFTRLERCDPFNA